MDILGAHGFFQETGREFAPIFALGCLDPIKEFVLHANCLAKYALNLALLIVLVL